MRTNSNAPVCRESDQLSSDALNAIEQRGDWISPDGHVERSNVEATAAAGTDGVDLPSEPSLSLDARIPAHLQPPKLLTSPSEGYHQANGQPVAGIAIEGSVAVPLSPFGFGGGATGSVGLAWDRFGGFGISLGASALAGWGVNVGVGVNASVSNAGTIHGNHETWQNSGGLAIAAGPVAVEGQPGQMESGLGIGMGIGVGAWAQANTQTVIPLVEPRLVFVNGKLLVPGR